MEEAEETEMQASGNNTSNSDDTVASTNIAWSNIKSPNPSSSRSIFTKVCVF